MVNGKIRLSADYAETKTGGRKQEAGGGKQEAGGRRQETG